MDMKPSRISEEQAIGILREHETGAKTADVSSKHGISSATFYKWKANYGGLDVSDAKHLKAQDRRAGELVPLSETLMVGRPRAAITPSSSRTTKTFPREIVAWLKRLFVAASTTGLTFF
jgi:putative transposase